MKRISSITLFVLALLLSLTPLLRAAPPEQERYIVVLHDSVGSPATAAREIAEFVGGQVGFIYEHALKGFSINLPPQAVGVLHMNPHVKYVEIDRIRYAFVQENSTGIQRIFADGNTNLAIDAIDDFRVDVDVAVIDTGVDFQHPDLNVAGGVNCTGRIFRAKCVSGGDDDHYHGTHVAGTIGALDNGIGVVGVAPGARLWSVKVLDKNGSGWSSWIIAGLDWVAANADTIEVANMSLGGSGFSQAEYDAIQGAVNAGVAFAVAAGNEDDDANNYSPGGFDNVLSVSALADFDGLPGGFGSPTCRTDQDDTLADFSNWGYAVDIAAPGVCIKSTYPIEKGEYGTISGTSMASPHAAGALALLASRDNPGNATDVFSLYYKVKTAGNNNWTDDSGDGITEPLLDVSNTTLFNPVFVAGSGGGEPPPPNNPPTAAFTFTTTGLTVAFADQSTDSDGSLVTWSWEFGDGSDSTAQNPSHTYATDGTYTVKLTVTDDDGSTDSINTSLTVSSSNGGEITLSANPYLKNRTKYSVDLTWSGASSANVDVFRDGSLIATTANDEAYTDGPIAMNTSVTYKVCEAGSSICSDEVTVTYP